MQATQIPLAASQIFRPVRLAQSALEAQAFWQCLYDDPA
jgi:hypothetical protein